MHGTLAQGFRVADLDVPAGRYKSDGLLAECNSLPEIYHRPRRRIEGVVNNQFRTYIDPIGRNIRSIALPYAVDRIPFQRLVGAGDVTIVIRQASSQYHLILPARKTLSPSLSIQLL